MMRWQFSQQNELLQVEPRSLWPIDTGYSIERFAYVAVRIGGRTIGIHIQ